ncbi:MAG: prepilin-type N-terminal cleavage/methylation domain-containing protein [Demequina sp.]|nr:prepilin-type N-terminal cleavage/methylation domain-containing protein [Demequina sp.]
MIARIHKSLEKKDKGFTLIELLVVIIIIGILAAIAIPVFLNQRKKAVDAGIKSDLRSIANELESYYVDNQAYPASITTSGSTITVGTGGGTVTKSNVNTTYTYTPATDRYTVKGQNSGQGTGKTYVYDSANGGLAD